MSLEIRGGGTRVTTAAAPLGARLADGPLEGLGAEILRRRLEAAREAGRREGAERALADAAGALDRAATELEAERERCAASLAREAVELGVEIARHLLRVEIQAGHYDLERIVRETLAASGAGRQSCTVHLCPADRDRLAHVPFRSGTQLEADPDVPPGDVHVSTHHGLLVRDLDDALKAIANRLTEEFA